MRRTLMLTSLSLALVTRSLIWAADIEWEDEHKEWTIKGKEMSCTDGDLIAKIDPAESLVITGRIKILAFGSRSTPELRAAIKGSIIFRDSKTADGCQYYGFAFRPDCVTLHRIVESRQGNQCVLLGQQKVPTPLGKWIKFKIATSGNKIQIAFSLPPALTIVVTDPAPLPAGGVRLRSYATTVAFKDVKIKAK